MSQVADIQIGHPVVAAPPTLGHPAVIGLAAFGMTTLMLQLHAFGLVGMGPVLWLGLVYGGAAQVVAGFQEQKTGNNFGYTVFVSFGCFWLSFCGMTIASKYGMFPVNKTDVGWFLFVWTCYACILTYGSLYTNKALIFAFITVDIGLILLTIEHFGGGEALATIAAWSMLGTVACVWYLMAHIVFLDVAKRDVLPAGKPWLAAKK